MLKEVPRSTPKLVGECSHSKFLPCGAFAMLSLYWAGKYPPAHSLLPHLAVVTNAVAGWLSVAVSRQATAKTTRTISNWWSHHVDLTGSLTLHLGKKGERLPQ